MKKKFLFAVLMGIVTTGIISCTILTLNTNLEGDAFYAIWLKSWFIAYIVVIPCILIISPVVEKLVNKIIKQ